MVKRAHKGLWIGLGLGLTAFLAVVLPAIWSSPHVSRFGFGNESIDPSQMTTFAPTTTWTAPTTGTWRQFDAGPLAGRSESLGFWTGTEMLVVGGMVSERYATVDDAAAYNPTSNTWRKISPIPGSGRVLAGVWTGRQLVVFRSDGINNGPMKDGWVYDPSTDHWHVVGKAPTGLGLVSVHWTGRDVLVWQPDAPLLYNPATDTWKTLPALSTVGGMGVTVNAAWTGRYLAVNAAVAPDDPSPARNRVFLLDPARATWRVSSVPTVDIQYALAPDWTGNEVALIAFAQMGGNAVMYNPVTDAWRTVPMPDLSQRAFLRSIRLADGRLVANTGNPQTPLNVFDPASATWKTSGPAPGPLPPPDGPFVSTGTSVLVWGVGVRAANSVDVGGQNVGWMWTPA